MQKYERLADLYSFKGFRTKAKIKPHPAIPHAKVVVLERRQKKQSVLVAARRIGTSMIEKHAWCAIFRVQMQRYISRSKYAV